MDAEIKDIQMYWWEGFYGLSNVFQRVVKCKRPYIKNFGDLLSPFIVSLLAGRNVRHTIASGKLLALGSIFFALSDKDIVWGSGFLNPKHIKFALSCQDVNFLSVRGPETRKLLMQHNIACPEVYGDPAILLPHLIKNDIEKKYAIGIVPHFSQYQYFHKIIKNDYINVIDVEHSFVEVMRNILSCKIILSTSLHGLIVAEAYGIPAFMLVIDKPSHEDLFKFEDYFHSTNRSLSFEKFNISKLNKLANLAIKQKKAYFNINKLLEAFPFKNNHLNLNLPILSWSNMNNRNYRHSIVPPRLTVP